MMKYINKLKSSRRLCFVIVTFPGLSSPIWFINNYKILHQVALFQFFFVCASMVSYVAFVLSLFVSHP